MNSRSEKIIKLSSAEQTQLDTCNDYIKRLHAIMEPEKYPEEYKKNIDEDIEEDDLRENIFRELKDCRAITLFKFYVKSDIFKEYFRSDLFENELAELKDKTEKPVTSFFANMKAEKLSLAHTWSDRLKEGGHIYSHLKSVDGKKTCALIDRIIGAYFFNEFTQKNPPESTQPTEGLAYLNNACQLGLLHALLKRCDINLAKIKNDTLSDDERDKAALQLEGDLKNLSNIYGTSGLLYASSYYNIVKDYLYQKNNNQISPQILEYWEKAVKSFQSGIFLSKTNAQEANNLIQEVCGEGGLPEIFKFKNWNEAKETVAGGLDPTVYNKWLTEAETELRNVSAAKMRPKAHSF